MKQLRLDEIMAVQAAAGDKAQRLKSINPKILIKSENIRHSVNLAGGLMTEEQYQHLRVSTNWDLTETENTSLTPEANAHAPTQATFG